MAVFGGSMTGDFLPLQLKERLINAYPSTISHQYGMLHFQTITGPTK